MTDKQRINQILQRDSTITLPAIHSHDGQAMSNKMCIKMDSVQNIAREGSIVDWIAKRGESEVLIGLSDGWLSLTDEQRDRIESAGKSFLIWRTDLIEDWHTAVKTGLQRREIELPYLGTVTEEVQVAYWVYHNKWGWQNGAQ